MQPNRETDSTREPDPRRSGDLGSVDVLGPLLSAAIFGYYGFFFGLSTDDGAGNTVPLFLATVWALRVAAVLFAAELVVAFLGAFAGIPRGGLIAGALGGVATLVLAIVTVWSIADPNWDIAINHLIMIICVLWNGYASIRAIREELR